MKLLKTIKIQDFGLKPKDKPLSFGVRKTARAVLINENNEVYLLNVHTKGYHKLPGGGIDQDEDHEQALLREIMEETGCKAEIQEELGRIVEIRDFFNTEQTSFCYIAKQFGSMVEQKLDKYEIDEGHDLVISKSIDEAIKILENDTPSDIEGKFILKRDLTLLRAAKKIMN